MKDKDLKKYVSKHNTEMFKGETKYILELYALILKEIKDLEVIKK